MSEVNFLTSFRPFFLLFVVVMLPIALIPLFTFGTPFALFWAPPYALLFTTYILIARNTGIDLRSNTLIASIFLFSLMGAIGLTFGWLVLPHTLRYGGSIWPWAADVQIIFGLFLLSHGVSGYLAILVIREVIPKLTVLKNLPNLFSKTLLFVLAVFLPLLLGGLPVLFLN